MSTLPRIEIVPLYQVPARDEFTEPKAQKLLALVVDDERVIADTLSIILARKGFATMTAYDGENALRMAAMNSPDVLLSDVMMGPGIDGVELAMAVTHDCPDCRVLLFSGHSGTYELLQKARAAGHDFPLLPKPLHPEELLVRVSTLMEMSAA